MSRIHARKRGSEDGHEVISVAFVRLRVPDLEAHQARLVLFFGYCAEDHGLRPLPFPEDCEEVPDDCRRGCVRVELAHTRDEERPSDTPEKP